MLKAGVLGLGKMGLRHLAAYDALHVDAAGFDPDPVTSLEASCRGVTTHSSVDALLDVVDVVSVCTPVSEHAQLIRAAIEANVHVLCEKPVVLDLATCDDLLETEASSSVVIAGGYLMRFAAEVYSFETAIRNPARYGKPLFACISKTAKGDHAAWKHSLRHGGGAGGEIVVHGLDLARHLLGEISPGLTASEILLPTRQIKGTSIVADAPDTVTEMLTAGQVPVVVQANMLGKVAYSSLSIIFEAGNIHARLGSAIVHEERGGLSEIRPVENRPWLLAEVQEFIHSVERGELGARMHGLADTRALLARRSP